MALRAVRRSTRNNALNWMVTSTQIAASVSAMLPFPPTMAAATLLLSILQIINVSNYFSSFFHFLFVYPFWKPLLYVANGGPASSLPLDFLCNLIPVWFMSNNVAFDLLLTRVCIGYQSKSTGMFPSRAQSSTFAFGTRAAHGRKVG
jgi:hypothetical protein